MSADGRPHELAIRFRARGIPSRVGCAAALRLAHVQPFDLLIADVGLPDGDGWDLLEQIRVRYPLVRGIVISGFAMPADIRHTQLAGYERHLTKPIDAEGLRLVIEEVMSVHEGVVVS